MLAIFLTICAACLALLGGVVLVSLPSCRRARRAASPGKHHLRYRPRAAGTVAPNVGGAR